jgi:hypothetical protein
MNYIVHLSEYMYILPILETPRLGSQLKQAVVKKFKQLYSSVNQ